MPQFRNKAVLRGNCFRLICVEISGAEMLSKQQNHDCVLHDIRELLAANDAGSTAPPNPALGISGMAKIEQLQQVRPEYDEFLRRLNKALSLNWRTVRPRDEYGHGDPSFDWVSRNGHILLEHSAGVNLLLKRFGQAQLFQCADRPDIIEHDEAELFDEVMHQLGHANYEDQRKFGDRVGAWSISLSFFTGCAAMALLMKVWV